MNHPDPKDNPENQYAIGRRMKVRKLSGEYAIVDSRMIGKKRRYDLRAVPDTGAVVPDIEAWGTDMTPVPEPEPLALVQEHASTFGLPEAPIADLVAPDGVTLDAGSFGGEPDQYSPGAQRSPGAGSDPGYDALPDEPGELQSPRTRNTEQPVAYGSLKRIVYNARLKGFERLSSREIEENLDPGTPIAVVLTAESNGHAIWIITAEPNCGREAHVEAFYPAGIGSEADAIEFAVLIALRQIPIKTGIIETSRLVS